MIKYIDLTQGKRTLVDAEDYEYLNQYKWYYKGGYAVRNAYVNGKRTTLRMQRVLLNPEDSLIVDHINRDKLDNRRSNLRLATKQQNSFNAISQNTSTSKFRGVSWKNRERKWAAQIGINGKNYWIGNFDTEIEAATAFNRKAKQLFGEFVLLNVI